MKQPKGFVDPNHPGRVCKFEKVIYDLNKSLRSRTFHLFRQSKKLVFFKMKRNLAFIS